MSVFPSSDSLGACEASIKAYEQEKSQCFHEESYDRNMDENNTLYCFGYNENSPMVHLFAISEISRLICDILANE